MDLRTTPSPSGDHTPGTERHLVAVSKCVVCHETKPVEQFVKSVKTKSGRCAHCKPCDNARRRQQRNARPNHRTLASDRLRKLPDYETLRRHYVDESMSMADIAELYDASKSAVYYCIRRRATKRGEWPLTPRIGHINVLKRGKRARSINPTLLMSLVYEYCKDNKITVRAFAQEHGFSPAYLYECHSGKYDRMDKRYAIRLLEAIGEPVPAHLRERRRKYSGAY